MNTIFFRDASDINKNFNWKDIFSDVFQPHTKQQKNSLLTKGIGDQVPAEQTMLKQWQKPWLFLRVGVVAVALSILALVSWNIFAGMGMGVLLFILPAFAIPLTALIFYWEMDISGKISIFELLLYMLLGGILSLTVTGIVRNYGLLAEVAYIAGPLPEELAKFVVVWLLLSRRKYCYGTQGIVIGGAVGAGFAAIETAGYAWNSYETAFQVAQYLSEVTQSLANTQLLRGVLAIGGHVVWAALYGGALGLAKGRDKMKISYLADPMVIMTWTGAFLLHTLWNLSAVDLVGILPEGLVRFLYNTERMFIKYVILIVLAWMFLFFVMRKCIRQMVVVCERAQPVNAESTGDLSTRHQQAHKRALLTVTSNGEINAGRSFPLFEGKSLVFGRDIKRANIIFPENTKGVSAVHCEIKKKEGYLVLIDRNSTYGTYFSNGTKLEPNVPYKLRDHVQFYLAAKENAFTVKIPKE